MEGDRVGSEYVEHMLRAGRGSGSRRQRLDAALEMLLHRGLGHHLAMSLGRRAYETRSQFHPDHVDAWYRLKRSLPRTVPYPIVSTLDLTRMGPTTDMLVFGGSNSTDESALLFEVSGPTTRRLSRCPDPIMPLHWVGLSDERDARLGPTRIARPRSGTVEPFGFFIDTASGQPAAPLTTMRVAVGGRLVEINTSEDLVITVAPNIFAAPITTRETAWPRMIILAGTTGLGTRAVELFLSDPGLALLEEITDQLDGWPFFQAHMVAGSLIHPTRKTARYTRLDLRQVRPIELTAEHYAAIHHAALTQLDDLPWLDPRRLFRDRQAIPPRRRRVDR